MIDTQKYIRLNLRYIITIITQYSTKRCTFYLRQLSWLEYTIIFIPKPGEHNKLRLPVGTKILLNRVGKPDKKEMFLQKTSFLH
jgi:hypothetical protein